MTPPRDRGEPVILHVDLDAFFASVEQLRDPRLRGKPVIVGNRVAASCSYEARDCGCYAGQPLAEARRLCPEVVILDGREAVYRAFAEAVFALCAELSPAMETFLDEAYLELTGTERLHGDPYATAAALKRRIRREVGLPVTVGLGPNRMLAKIAGKSVKPDGLRWIRRAEVEAVLPALPVERLPGVGRRVARELGKRNLRTVGDLRALSIRDLTRMFGAAGRLLYERCRGRDTQPVSAREVPRSISRESAFSRPVTDPRHAEAMLYYLTERAARHARGLGLAARGLRVWVDATGAGRNAVTRTLPAASDQDTVLFERAQRLFRSLCPRREALRRVGVALVHLEPRSAGQEDLFAPESASRRERLCRSLDAVRSRFGHGAVVAGPSVRLLGELDRDRRGFVLRTPSLAK